ncbi:membrane protein [Actinotalea ferrariae CF5-4]|uniref:Membrane protein n=1 Tax=Actinotalea ferrariae CF5-4 TaxID=948458 RepID=A0A021VRY8_9CELL|nr:DUF3566 domain-containing protein [Actinotalea ferrariae]EYR63911.1 membrane protein [Actinotalea ferrariae CF5-4]
MSTDGTQPRPTSPTAPGRTSVRTAESAPQTDVRTTAERPAVPARDGGASPSVSDRLKAAGAAVAGAVNRDDRPASSRPGVAPREEAGASAATTAPRRVRLALARIDPWSVMKLSFLLSFAVGIMMVVAAAVVWFTLDGQGVFAQLDQTITEITGNPDFFPMEEYVAFDRVMALATIIAIVDVVLLTALATIGAFLYNIVAALVGGIHMTLTDD